MLELILIVLFFALLIGIFIRSKSARDKKTGVTCPSCHSNINPRATVCPHCSRDVDHAAVIKQLKRGQTRAYVTAAIVVAVLVGLYFIGRVNSEPQEGGWTGFSPSPSQ